MECESGSIVAIVGDSGSGKTTLINILAMLDSETAGIYRWNDMDVFSLNKEDKEKLLAEEIGIVFQHFNLINNMNCYDNVKIPLYLNSSIDRKDRDRIIKDILECVGLEDRMLHYPNTLSGGEQQRLAIARALIKNPKIIFADEPTGNVDKANEKKILDLFRKIADSGHIVILATHSDEVKKIADKVYKISKGVMNEL